METIILTLVGLLAFAPLPIVLFGLLWQLGLSGGTPEQAFWSGTVALNYFSWEVSRNIHVLLGEIPRAMISSSVAMICAIPFAWVWRTGPKILKSIHLSLMGVLLVIPGPVIALGIIDLFQSGWLPHGIAQWYGTSFPMMWGQVLKIFPIQCLLMMSAFSRLEDDLWEAATLEGQTPWGMLMRIAVPSSEGFITGGIAVGTVLTLSELPTSKLLAAPGYEPASVRLFALLHQGTGNRQAAAALVLAGVSLLLVSVIFGMGFSKNQHKLDT
jgi:ABC-type Fe3+ transport system permease subunit